MSRISSLNSISTLNLWLDSTDLSTIITSLNENDIIQWNDKSSNAYQFVPLRLAERPKISTNGVSSVAVLFDQVSSFQLISKTKIGATSTLDFFTVVTPYSLWGPRAPIFDSADITLSETDTRFNVQVYADGNEFFRNVTTQTITNGATIYNGELYVGSYEVGRGPNGVNYLQKYNRVTRTFEYINIPIRQNFTHALAVYNQRIYTANGSVTTFNSGGNSGQGIGPVEYWNGRDTRFLSTSFMSTFPGPIAVHKRNLYAVTASGWNALYINNNTPTFATQNRTQLYVLNPLTNNLNFVSNTIVQFNNLSVFSSNINNGGDWTNFTSNLVSFRGDLFIASGCNNNVGYSLTRYTNQDTYVSSRITSNIAGYLSVYMGNAIVPSADNRIFMYNESSLEQIGRWASFPAFSNYYSGNAFTWYANGGMTTYKGKLHGIFTNANILTVNAIQVFNGDKGSTYCNAFSDLFTKNRTFNGNSNLMIIHDGKLFIQNGTQANIIEYGNGISLDQSFSTLVGAPILVNVRKSPNNTQLYLNGILVESESVSFSYSNQSDREMLIGGAAGLMSSGQSDSGSDHMQGAIHAVAQYTSNLNTADRQRVEGILTWTFNIQNILPASHPYRNSSP